MEVDSPRCGIPSDVRKSKVEPPIVVIRGIGITISGMSVLRIRKLTRMMMTRMTTTTYLL